MIQTSRPPSVRSNNTDAGDPFAALMRPPPTESPHERQLRLQREAEAKRISDSIDEAIKTERELWKKRKEDVKLLLLGQAESGKSTLQKQFQLMHNPGSLEEERLSWRTVIYYNIARPVRQIFEAVDAMGEGEGYDDGTPDNGDRAPSQMDTTQPDQPHDSSQSAPAKTEPDAQLAALRVRLAALLGAESSLAERLSGGVAVSGSGKGSVFVRSGWQGRSVRLSIGGPKARDRGDGSRFSLSGRRSSTENPARNGTSDEDRLIEEVSKIVADCKEDIRTLWKHPIVQRLKDRRMFRLEEWAEFFLDNIERVSSPGYVPTLDDILHARIQTMGVAEHIFDVFLHGRTVTWHLYDVGGARGQRHSWVPYFDDANAIIFVAPVSAYDQYLAEDPRTNRIDDSLQLFTQICSNTLLKDVHLVLFLNKTDVLQAKLAKGIRVKKYITSYGDRPNEFESVVKYFSAHFAQVHKRNNENKRVLYTHLTNVTDTKATQSIITNVRDSIFRGLLKSAALV